MGVLSRYYHLFNQIFTGRRDNDYLDHFHSLVSDTRYTDPHTLVVKFHQGLRAAIQSQIATMPTRCPGDADPQAWFKAACQIDQACLANEAFQSGQRSLPTVISKPPRFARSQLAPFWSL